jgi:hypothetical protein
MSRLKALMSLFLFLILALLFPERAAGMDNLLVTKINSHVALQTPVVCVNQGGLEGTHDVVKSNGRGSVFFNNGHGWFRENPMMADIEVAHEVRLIQEESLNNVNVSLSAFRALIRSIVRSDYQIQEGISHPDQWEGRRDRVFFDGNMVEWEAEVYSQLFVLSNQIDRQNALLGINSSHVVGFEDILARFTPKVTGERWMLAGLNAANLAKYIPMDAETENGALTAA